MRNAADIAAALRGRRSGDGWLCCCPVPSHGKGKGDRNPSLLVKDGDVAVLVTCFGGCDRLDVLDELRHLGLLDDDRRDWQPSRRPAPPPPLHNPDPEAIAIVEASQPIGGTLAERYLAEHRGIRSPYPPSLMFHPSLIYAMTRQAMPAMIASVQRPGGVVVAVQATFLAADGRKAPVAEPRWTYGALGEGAIRLAPATDVLGLAEGTESAFAAQLLTGVPCWASLGAEVYQFRLSAIRRAAPINPERRS